MRTERARKRQGFTLIELMVVLVILALLATVVTTSVVGKSEDDVVEELKQGDPPIWTRVNPYEGGMQLGTVGLNDGEEEIVAERLGAVLRGDKR